MQFFSTRHGTSHNESRRFSSQRAFDFSKTFKDVGEVTPSIGATSPHIFGTPNFGFGNIPSGGAWVQPQVASNTDDGLKVDQHSNRSSQVSKTSDLEINSTPNYDKNNPWGLVIEEGADRRISFSESLSHLDVKRE